MESSYRFNRGPLPSPQITDGKFYRVIIILWFFHTGKTPDYLSMLYYFYEVIPLYYMILWNVLVLYWCVGRGSDTSGSDNGPETGDVGGGAGQDSGSRTHT